MFRLLKFLILVIIVAVLGVMFLPIGSVEFKDPEMMGALTVPSFAMYEGEMVEASGKYVAKFQTVRSEWALKQEFGKIMQEKYVMHECPSGEMVYYDQKNYLTIYNYMVEQGVPFSKFQITYGRGNQCS